MLTLNSSNCLLFLLFIIVYCLNYYSYIFYYYYYYLWIITIIIINYLLFIICYYLQLAFCLLYILLYINNKTNKKTAMHGNSGSPSFTVMHYNYLHLTKFSLHYLDSMRPRFRQIFQLTGISWKVVLLTV